MAFQILAQGDQFILHGTMKSKNDYVTVIFVTTAEGIYQVIYKRLPPHSVIRVPRQIAINKHVCGCTWNDMS